jgi:hypothetical protein
MSMDVCDVGQSSKRKLETCVMTLMHESGMSSVTRCMKQRCRLLINLLIYACIHMHVSVHMVLCVCKVWESVGRKADGLKDVATTTHHNARVGQDKPDGWTDEDFHR